MNFARLISMIAFLSTTTQAFDSFADIDTQAILDRICKSPDPVLVLDTFGPGLDEHRNIDVDGDGIYDLHHGEFVAQLAELGGQKTIRESVSVPGPMGMTIYPEKLAEVLNSTAENIEKGQLKVSWINFSQGFTAEFSSLNKLLGLKDEIHRNNVDLYALKILEELWTKKPAVKLKEIYQALERMKNLGIPVVAAAGNEGAESVNIYSLFPQVISVGALDLDGKKAGYSADNSLVSVWRPGSVVSQSSSDGLDFNQDGKIDLLMSTRKISDEILARYSGKNADQVSASIPEEVDQENVDSLTSFLQLTAKLPEGLFNTRLILRKSLATAFQQARYLEALGDYFYLDGKDPRPLFFMKANSLGMLSTKQGSGSSNFQYRNELYGTSFASPSICWTP